MTVLVLPRGQSGRLLVEKAKIFEDAREANSWLELNLGRYLLYGFLKEVEVSAKIVVEQVNSSGHGEVVESPRLDSFLGGAP